jgi:hypothetical protein
VVASGETMLESFVRRNVLQLCDKEPCRTHVRPMRQRRAQRIHMRVGMSDGLGRPRMSCYLRVRFAIGGDGLPLRTPFERRGALGRAFAAVEFRGWLLSCHAA